MAETATQRLARERAKEKEMAGKDGTYMLPADYSSLIKQAQAEGKASGNKSVPAQSSRPAPARDVPQRTSQSSGRIPTPQSASGSPSGNVPTPTARPTPTGEESGANEQGAMQTVMTLIAGAVGGAAATALYKRITSGDKSAIAEAKTIVEQEQGKVSNNEPGTAVAKTETPDIQDAEWEDIPPEQITQQKQIAGPQDPEPKTNMDDPRYKELYDSIAGDPLHKWKHDPETSIERNPDQPLSNGEPNNMLRSRMSPVDESIDAQIAPGQDSLEQAMIAKGYEPDMPTGNATGNASGRLMEQPDDIEAIIRQEVERGGRAGRKTIPKIKPKL